MSQSIHYHDYDSCDSCLDFWMAPVPLEPDSDADSGYGSVHRDISPKDTRKLIPPRITITLLSAREEAEHLSTIRQSVFYRSTFFVPLSSPTTSSTCTSTSASSGVGTSRGSATPTTRSGLSGVSQGATSCSTTQSQTPTATTTTTTIATTPGSQGISRSNTDAQRLLRPPEETYARRLKDTWENRTRWPHFFEPPPQVVNTLSRAKIRASKESLRDIHPSKMSLSTRPGLSTPASSNRKGPLNPPTLSSQLRMGVLVPMATPASPAAPAVPIARPATSLSSAPSVVRKRWSIGRFGYADRPNNGANVKENGAIYTSESENDSKASLLITSVSGRLTSPSTDSVGGNSVTSNASNGSGASGLTVPASAGSASAGLASGAKRGGGAFGNARGNMFGRGLRNLVNIYSTAPSSFRL